jgi:hypothetical protein
MNTFRKLKVMTDYYSEWYNEKYVSFSGNENKYESCNLHYKYNSKPYDIEETKKLSNTFCIPNSWVSMEYGEITNMKDMLSTRRMYRYINFNPDRISVELSSDGKRCNLRITEHNNLTIAINDRRFNIYDEDHFLGLQTDSIKSCRIVMYDSHEGDINTLNRYKFYLVLGFQCVDITPARKQYEKFVNENEHVGLDVGVSNLCTLSKPVTINGKTTRLIKWPSKNLKLKHHIYVLRDKLTKLTNRKRSVMYKSGQRMPRIKDMMTSDEELSKLYYELRRCEEKLMNQRRTFIQNFVRYLFSVYPVVCMEHDLRWRSQYQNTIKYFSFMISCGDYLQSYIKSYVRKHGYVVVQTPRQFSSSHCCSTVLEYDLNGRPISFCNGYISTTNLPISKRDWRCPKCGAYHNRDINAARNIEQVGDMCIDYKLINGRYPTKNVHVITGKLRYKKPMSYEWLN